MFSKIFEENLIYQEGEGEKDPINYVKIIIKYGGGG